MACLNVKKTEVFAGTAFPQYLCQLLSRVLLEKLKIQYSWNRIQNVLENDRENSNDF